MMGTDGGLRPDNSHSIQVHARVQLHRSTLMLEEFLNVAILVLSIVVLYQGDYLTPVYPSVDERGLILVTGASSGIGKHATQYLAAKGFHVLAGVRRQAQYDVLLSNSSSNERKANIMPLLIDVTSSESISKAVDVVNRVSTDLNLPLIAIVNNAGIALTQQPLEKTDQSEIRRVFDTNVFGAIDVTQQFLPTIRQSHGRIIMISSLAGIIAGPMTSTYAASKRALESYSDSLRRELAPFQISVSVIEPGYIQSNIIINSNNNSNGKHESNTMSSPSAGDDSYDRYVAMQKAVAEGDKNGVENGDPPIVSSEAIYDAIISTKPKTRYMVGKLHKTIYFFTTVLTDRYLDWLLTSGMLKYFDFCIFSSHC